MSNWSANLNLPYIAASQAQKHVTHNEAVELLDALTQLTVMGFDTTLPPLFALDGQVWGIGSPATNAWAGRDGDLALWSNGGWVFVTPQAGWQAAMGTDVRVFDGTVWGQPLHQNLSNVGIRTSADADNALAVASPATLFTHQGGGHQVKINKATATDTASLLFQTGFSGRVEMGTAGSDNFEIKTSADGAAWQTALSASSSTGRIAMGAGLSVTGLEVTGTITGNAVQSSPTDTGAGRLMPVGAFGLGAAELVNINDPNVVSATGSYRIFGSANMPTGGIFVLKHSQRFSGQAVQIAYLSGSPQRIYQRHFFSGVWSSWRAFSETVGAVTQFGGLATGACMEAGTNANGRFERFAHGMQACWQPALTAANANIVMGSRWRSADVTWTYPASFVTGAVPAITAICIDGDSHARVLSVSATSAVLRVVSDISKSGAITLHVSAKGRWADITG